MDVMISIPDDMAVKLKERAATNGQTLPVYAAKLVADTVTKPTIDELLSPVRADFTKTGMSEDELLNFFRGEFEAHREEKKAKTA